MTGSTEAGCAIRGKSCAGAIGTRAICASVVNVVDIVASSFERATCGASFSKHGQAARATRLVSPASAWCAARTWGSAKSWRGALRALGLVRRAYRLTDDNHLAFLQIAFDNFGRDAVGKTDLDSARLGLAVSTQDPDYSGLSFKYWRACRSKRSLTTLLTSALLISAGRGRTRRAWSASVGPRLAGASPLPATL